MNMLKYLSFFFVKILAIIVFVYIKNIMYGFYLRNCLSYNNNLYNNFHLRYEINKKKYINFSYFETNKNFFGVRFKENSWYDILLFTVSKYLILCLSFVILNNALEVYDINLFYSSFIFFCYFLVQLLSIYLKFSVNVEKNKYILYERDGSVNNIGLVLGRVNNLKKDNNIVKIVVKYNNVFNEFIYNLNDLKNNISKNNFLVLNYLDIASLKESEGSIIDIEESSNGNIIDFDKTKINDNIFNHLIENINFNKSSDTTIKDKRITYYYNKLPIYLFQLHKNNNLSFVNSSKNEIILLVKLFLNFFDNIFIYIDIFFNFFLAFNSILFIIGYITDIIEVLKESNNDDLHDSLFPVRTGEQINFYKYFETYIFYILYLVLKNTFENFISYIYFKKNIKVKHFGKKETYFFNFLDIQIFYICFVFIIVFFSLISLKTFILNL